MAEPTRRDPAPGQPGEAAVTRVDSGSRPSQKDDAQRRLPPELAARFEVQWEFPAGGAEADVYRVLERASGLRQVLKVYRFGLQLKAEVLERLSQAQSPYLIGLHEHGE